MNLLKCSDRDTSFKIGNYIMKTLKRRKNTLNPTFSLLTLQNPGNSLAQ